MRMSVPLACSLALLCACSAPPAPGHATPEAHAGGAHAAPAAHATGPTADEALALLRAGNERFVRQTMQHPGQTMLRLHELEDAQHPFAVIVGCSDSRVPPEIVFDEGLGDLFVIREAGHVADAATLASVEYAVAHLGVRLVVVLGHDTCGAVNAAVGVLTADAVPEGHIVSLVDAIRPAVERAGEARDGLVERAVAANVDLVVEQLRKSHPILSQRVARGEVRVEGAVYDLHSGRVEWR